jgi:hypothetical protein
MKSMLAKHAPQSSPCAPTRARQEMQTGGSSRSAAAEKIDVTDARPRRASGCVSSASADPASSIVMGVMIGRQRACRNIGMRAAP